MPVSLTLHQPLYAFYRESRFDSEFRYACRANISYLTALVPGGDLALSSSEDRIYLTSYVYERVTTDEHFEDRFYLSTDRGESIFF